jgi:hypothetical protein
VKVLGDLAVLELAVEGFGRPLLTLVREGEHPARGEEVSITVDPASVLVFPAEPLAGDEKLIGEPLEIG